MSTFTWLDSSEAERRRAMDVVALLGEHETREELGLGCIRDAFADILAPGTSTIQTRARYFLFIPWIYQDIEERQLQAKLTAKEIAERLRKKEVELIKTLAASDDPAGTIGAVARERLKRLPSNVFWRGLEILGIRLIPGSQAQYHRALAAGRRTQRSARSRTEEQEATLHRQPSWHPAIPPPPKAFIEEATFKLTNDEAEYLRDRILNRASDSLFAFLVDRAVPVEPSHFPWETQLEGLPAAIAGPLEHARRFSETIFGASLLYNLQLSRLVRDENRINSYSDQFGRWSAAIEGRRAELESWDRAQFWRVAASKGAAIPTRTRQFVDDWLDLLLKTQSSAEDLRDSPQAHALIEMRERALKGDEQSRLVSPRAREIWQGASGAFQMDFRWRVTRTLVNDIVDGLQGRTTDA